MRTLPWQSVLLLLLSAVSLEANLYPRRDGFTVLKRGDDVFGLHARQIDGSGDTLQAGCIWACDVAACGTSCAPATRKRDVLEPHFDEREHRLWNESSDDWYSVSAAEYNATILHRRALAKRAWNFNPRWNRARISTYLPQQLTLDGNGNIVGSPDTQFTSNLGFFNGGRNQGTRSQQQAFQGSGPFQFGTGGLHGCTMLAVISNRGVYMAHFWETYTTNGNDNVAPGSQDLQNWQTKVLNAITGRGPQDSLTAGPAIDWSLFNAQGDNTFAAVMTPVAHDQTAGSSVIQYPQKISLIHDTIQANVPGAAWTIFGYQRLEYTVQNAGTPNEKYVGPDANMVDTSERGMCLFQYDGAGQYRLFYEQSLYQN